MCGAPSGAGGRGGAGAGAGTGCIVPEVVPVHGVGGSFGSAGLR